MVGFATGKQSHTGKRVRETGKVIVTVPCESLAGAVMAVSYTHLDVYKRQICGYSVRTISLSASSSLTVYICIFKNMRFKIL